MEKFDLRYIDELHSQYAKQFGSTNDIVRLQHSVFDNIVPIALDILTFKSIVGHDKSFWKDDTYIATAGMSTRIMNGPLKRVEIIMAIEADCLKKNPESIKKQFAELALIPFRENAYIAPGMIIENFYLPFFEHMSHVIVSDWLCTEPTHFTLHGEEIVLLQLCPVSHEERVTINEIGIVNALEKIAIEKVRFGDPDRPPIEFEKNILSSQ